MTLTLRRGVVTVLTAALLLTSVAPASFDQAQADNAIRRVAKSSLYGGALGLLLGGAVALVKDDDRDEALRWGLVAGVFGGFFWGIYNVSSGRDDFFHRSGDRTSFDPSPYMIGQVDPSHVYAPAGSAFRQTTVLRSTTGVRDEFTPHTATTPTDRARSHAAHLAD